MQQTFRVILILLLLFFGSRAMTAWAVEESLDFGRFGEVTIYRESPTPSHVVLFVSGDGGWNLGVVDMARSLAAMDTLVVGIDITRYLKETGRAQENCTYWAADFEELSHYVQKRLNLPRYLPPVLVGYSSGATLVYATLIQAPAGTFAGAISLGFCPDLTLPRPPCEGAGLVWQRGEKQHEYLFQPKPELAAPWVVLQGEIDQVCDPAATKRFAGAIGNAELITLPKVGHGFGVQSNWLPQFRAAFQRMVAVPVQSPSAQAVADLPLKEVPAATSAKTMAVMVSGDGGWAGLDRDLAAALAGKGVNVVGVNSLQYFWHRRTPAEAAHDLERILVHYADKWQPERIVLVGYSMGAEVLPFMVSRLPADLAQKIDLLALLAPGPDADFEIHVANWFGLGKQSGTWPVAAEIAKLTLPKVLCFYGSRDRETVCPTLDRHHAQPIELGGGHHFGGASETIATQILGALP